jgi:hypothetical protein
MKRLHASLLLVAVTIFVHTDLADAQRRGGGGRGGGGFRGGGGGYRGGGGGFSRGAARPSVSSRPSGGSLSRPSTPSAGRDVGRPGTRPGGDRTNIGGDRTNISNRPVNIRDTDIVAGGGRWDGGYGCCYHGGWGAAAAGFAVGAAAASLAYGSVVYSLPVGCSTTVVGGATYSQCGDVWYAPQFVGEDVNYVVVAAPE